MTGWWERFWFKPEPTSSLAVLRIALGLLVFAWTLSLAPDLDAFFGRAGLLSRQVGGAGVWGALGIFRGDLAVQVLFVVLLIASFGLIVGCQTRLAALLVFVGVMSFERRDPFAFNTGDGLIRLIAFYLMLAPAGAALSLDRFLTARERFWEFPWRAPWALRLMQIQLSVLYIGGLWIKVQGTTWNDGTAASYAMRISDLHRFPLPSLVTHSLLMANFLTYGTLVVEASVAILVWNRRLRPWVLLIGACMHVGIEWSIRVGFFSVAMLTLYLSFLDPHWTQAQLLGLRRRAAGRLNARVAGVGRPRRCAGTSGSSTPRAGRRWAAGETQQLSEVDGPVRPR